MTQSDKPAANTMWGGRFASGPDAIMTAINASIGFDQRLYAQDIAGSRAHAAMLAATGIITDSDAKAIREGLLTVLSEIESGKFTFRTDLEDIHLNIESRLTEIVGDAGKRVHTARSRNDQVAVDFRLWVRDQCDAATSGLTALMQAFLAQAEAGADWVMPGFTHLQVAQPVTWGHHMLAYVEMLGRDRSRFADARKRMNECPLGAAALAGTGFPIDRHMTAAALGFDRPTANSLDSVSDRHLCHPPVALCRRVGNLVHRAISLCQTVGQVDNRFIHYAAEKEPRCCRTAARQDRADFRGYGSAVHRDEGPAADLFQGYAGRQRTGL